MDRRDKDLYTLKKRHWKYTNKIDLTDLIEPGDIYTDDYGRTGIVEKVYHDMIFCNHILESGYIYKECFNRGTLIEQGVI